MMIMTKNTYIRPAVEVVAVDNGPALLADSASIEIAGTPGPISNQDSRDDFFDLPFSNQIIQDLK